MRTQPHHILVCSFPLPLSCTSPFVLGAQHLDLREGGQLDLFPSFAPYQYHCAIAGEITSSQNWVLYLYPPILWRLVPLRDSRSLCCFLFLCFHQPLSKPLANAAYT
jgi:hypothetical protein